MKEGKSSRTAEVVAAIRAVESMRPKHQRVCCDPYARHFLSTKYRLICKSASLARAALWLVGERRMPGVVGEVVLRTRYIDEYVIDCIGNGIQQLVILGAGYDARAYRIEGLKAKVKVFEVDHPASQKTKTERLKMVLGSLPNHVVYVAIDFEKEKLDQRLFASGYDRNLRTLFIWEGVIFYLTAEVVDETLAFVANNSGQGSSIIFNYPYQSMVDGTYESGEAKLHRKHLARLGEPFIFGIEDGKIEEFLSTRGFYQIKNASPGLLKSTYFTGSNQGRKACPYIPTVHATVRPRA